MQVCVLTVLYPLILTFILLKLLLNFCFPKPNRLCLSALPYNENPDRMQAVTIDGRPRYCILFPKSKHGEHSVREIKTKATYGGYLKMLLGQCYLLNMEAIILVLSNTDIILIFICD